MTSKEPRVLIGIATYTENIANGQDEYSPTQSFSAKELKRKHFDLVRKYMPDLNRKQRRAKVANDIRAMNPDAFLAQIRARLQNSINGVGVLSLSATDRNILLWSHYAAGHTGLCLKFIATDHTPFLGCALPVNYTATYPEINVLSPPDKQIDAFLLTKAIDWSYEAGKIYDRYFKIVLWSGRGR